MVHRDQLHSALLVTKRQLKCPFVSIVYKTLKKIIITFRRAAIRIYCIKTYMAVKFPAFAYVYIGIWS